MELIDTLFHNGHDRLLKITLIYRGTLFNVWVLHAKSSTEEAPVGLVARRQRLLISHSSSSSSWKNFRAALIYRGRDLLLLRREAIIITVIIYALLCIEYVHWLVHAW